MGLLQILNKIISKNSGLCHKWSLKIFQNLFWCMKIAFLKYFNKIVLKSRIKRLILALIILKNCSTIYPQWWLLMYRKWFTTIQNRLNIVIILAGKNCPSFHGRWRNYWGGWVLMRINVGGPDSPSKKY